MIAGAVVEQACLEVEEAAEAAEHFLARHSSHLQRRTSYHLETQT
jgi:hypothetical protein